MVSIAAFQAVDPGSIPGRRSYFVLLIFIERREDPRGLLVKTLAYQTEDQRFESGARGVLLS